MQKLIPVINKLQDVFSNIGSRQTNVDLPQIVVLGSQSSGKSSVLEAIVGDDFLPRGAGIVTRRPLILQLVHSEGSGMKADLRDSYLERKKVPYQKDFTKFEDIRNGIAYCTEKACPGKAISDAPIRLRIQSNKVIDLTLVDLPGLTKVAVENQSPDVPKLIKKMVTQFVQRKNSIILAITGANQDIATSTGIKLAKEVDPDGERTLGVLTKLDIMDKGLDAYNILTGKFLPLTKGYVGVVNRCQADIVSKKPIEEALRSERKFFASHPKYRSIASRQGIPYLTMRLNQILLEHIRKVLPELREKIETLLAHARERLVSYGPPIDEEGMGMRSFLLQLITKFSTEYVDAIEGRNITESQELFGGARINYIFYKKYIPSLTMLDPMKNLSDFDIRLRIQISKGTKTTLYIPETAFESMVKMQVKRLELPCLHCCDLIEHELSAIVDHCLRPLKRFPELRVRMKEYAIRLLKQYMKPLKDHIRDLIRCELAYINTNHPNFFGGGTKVLLLMEKIRRGRSGSSSSSGLDLPLPNRREDRVGTGPLGRPVREDRRSTSQRREEEEEEGRQHPRRRNGLVNDREKMEVEVIRTLLGQYFEIVKVKVSDAVPKAIMHFLVNMSCKNLHAELIRGLYSEGRAGELLKENEEVQQKRKATRKMLGILLKAQEVLNEVRDCEM